MISDLINRAIKKVSKKAIGGAVSDEVSESLGLIEKNLERKLDRLMQRNLIIATRRLKREMLHSSIMMFSFMLIIFGVLLMLNRYFSIEYILVAAGFVLLSITIISK
jgi:hypothetical protein